MHYLSVCALKYKSVLIVQRTDTSTNAIEYNRMNEGKKQSISVMYVRTSINILGSETID